MKYWIKWAGTEKGRGAYGELPLPKKIGEEILKAAVTLYIGKQIIKEVKKR